MFQSKNDGIRMARSAIDSYEDQIEEFSSELSTIEKDRKKILREIGATLARLAEGLIPSRKPEVIRRAGVEIGALHLEGRLHDLERSLEESHSRVEAIDSDQSYRDRDLLIHPTTGQYTVELTKQQELIDVFEKDAKRFDFDSFKWLYRRKFHKPKNEGAFQKFFKAITLTSYREEKALSEVQETLGYEDFPTAVDAYEELQEKLKFHREEGKKWKDLRQGVVDLVEERERQGRFIDDFDLEARDALREEATNHLSGCDFEEIHRNVRPAAKVLAGKAHALSKKVTYLEDLERYLQEQIQDRRERIHSIDRVRRKWSRKPYGMLRGDKTKWLQTVPDMKRQGATKRVRWVSTMRHNISEYDSYDRYSHLMDASIAFIAYDAFAYRAHERMPYEGFTRGVIPELESFREEHDMDGPDNAAMAGALAAATAYDEEWFEPGEEEAWDEEAAIDKADEALADEAQDEDSVMDEES